MKELDPKQFTQIQAGTLTDMLLTSAIFIAGYAYYQEAVLKQRVNVYGITTSAALGALASWYLDID